MMKKLFAMLLMLMLCLGLAVTANAATITPSQPSGSGTSSSPYLIGTKEELYWFADAVYGGDHDACAKLTADITVNEQVLDGSGLVTGNLVNWLSIEGYDNAAYTGTFDGNNHTISSLYAVKTVMYEGFFGNLEEATVKNLTIN